jgi:hypothetical protein
MQFHLTYQAIIVNHDVIQHVQFPTHILITVSSAAEDATSKFEHWKKSEKNKTLRKEHERVKLLPLSNVTVFL